MKKKQSLEHWLSTFTARLGRKLDPIETAVFEGAFELGWDAAENEMIKLCGGNDLDEFGRTDAQLEFEVNEMRERSYEA
jgi:hypothetical protein